MSFARPVSSLEEMVHQNQIDHKLNLQWTVFIFMETLKPSALSSVFQSTPKGYSSERSPNKYLHQIYPFQGLTAAPSCYCQGYL